MPLHGYSGAGGQGLERSSGTAPLGQQLLARQCCLQHSHQLLPVSTGLEWNWDPALKPNPGKKLGCSAPHPRTAAVTSVLGGKVPLLWVGTWATVAGPAVLAPGSSRAVGNRTGKSR